MENTTKSHRSVRCWSKNKEREDGVDNLFVGEKLCAEVSESNNDKYLEEWSGDNGASLYITYRKKNLRNI